MPEAFIVPEFTEKSKEVSDTDTKEKAKEKPKEKVSLPISFVERFFENIFKSIALIGGKHWELTKEEVKDLAVSGKPMIDKYLEFFIKYMIEITFIMALVRIIGGKAKIQLAINEEKKKLAQEAQLKSLVRQQVNKEKGEDFKTKKELRDENASKEIQKNQDDTSKEYKIP
jgi:hypothetical protein